ncbi:MAG: erythromycin esterase family protein, partial [Chloroflexi bacterium]|nr:erythromycin esterase family protein [Chloroflexota bacterium]
FSFIAVEGDWPDCYRVNRYIKGYPVAGDDAHTVLYAFDRWPTWMWANWEMVAFTEWLRQYNATGSQPVGFYGLDVYSLWESMEAIIDYLERTHPETVDIAKRAYTCFEPYGEDAQSYAWRTAIVPETCEADVINLLSEIQQQVRRFPGDPEAALDAEQNAFVTVNAERYYRTMIRGDVASWNIRDHHMMDTLDRLIAYHGDESKAIVWAHNTHIGDARATDMAGEGMVNIGQLTRERHRSDGVILAGFGSYRGSVIAGQEWGAPMERINVPRARPGSWEDVFHQAGEDSKLRILEDISQEQAFLEARGHRAIGVVYRPERERFGNYVPTVLPQRYDAFLYFDETQALNPLHLQPQLQREPPETYPWGF